MTDDRRALVMVMSLAHNDPRVRRQLTWLRRDGWTVDTVGMGPTPSDEVTDHFPVGNQRRWVRTPLGALIAYRLLTKRTMFKRLTLDRLEPEVLSRIAEGQYSLIVFNDLDFLPMLEEPTVFTPEALTAHIHADIHEYRDVERVPGLWGLLTHRFSTWRRELIGSPAISSRTTVASRIADLYAADFGIEPPQLVRNIPPYHELTPSEVRPDRIRLVFHGLASSQRGFDRILEAMRLLDDRYEMTFMLTGNPTVVNDLKQRIQEFGERVRLVPPVPMVDLPKTVNQYDLEIIFYPPTHKNVEFSLPNKFFEAIQGRLAIVVGESSMMSEVVRQYNNGIVVPGWEGSDLATAISGLTPERIAELKANSDRAAKDLNAEKEGEVFLEALRPARGSS